jgi:5'-nucleotidase/UDP-sugar diphosphatase
MPSVSRRRLLGAAGVLAAAGALPARAAEPVKLTFVLVNDIYEMNAVEGRGGIPRLATVVKAERARNPNTIFAHAGDTLSPSLFSGFDQGAHMIALFNDLPPDVFVPGNHEFDFGREVYLKRMAEARFPVLAANLRAADGGSLPAHRDTLMLERGGLKIGIVGCTLDTAGLVSSPDGLQIADTLATIAAAAKALRADGADLTVAVVHADKETGRRIMAARVVDIVLSGHNHDLHIDYDGRVALAESGQDADYVVAVDVVVAISGEGAGRRVAWHPNYRIFDTADIKPDPALLAKVNAYEIDLARELDVPVATLGTSLDSRTRVVRSGEAAIGDLFADAMRAQSGAEIAVINGGSLRGNREYPVGYALTRRDILSELPFGNRTVVTRVKGAAIRLAMENGFSRVDVAAGRFPQVSGLRIVADFGAEPGHRVLSIEVNGSPLEDERVYQVAINDFMLRGGDGYEPLAGDTHLTLDSGERLIANDVMAYARKLGTLSATVEGRIRGK